MRGKNSRRFSDSATEFLPAIPTPEKHGSKHGSPPRSNKLIHNSTNLRHSAQNRKKRTFPKAFDLGKASFSLAGKGFEPHDLRVMRCHLSNLYQKMRKFRGFQEVFRVSKGRFSRGSRAVVAPHGSKHESGMGQKMGQPKTGFRRRCRRSRV